MNKATEQLTATAKTNLEAAQALATKAQAYVEKLVDLNLAASKAVLSESLEHAQAVLSAKDPQTLMQLQAGLVKPAGEKVAAYAQHLQKIVTDANAEFTKTAQANLAEVQKGFTSLIEGATKNAPAGTESATAFFNQALSASQAAFKTVQASTQQAIDTAQSNFAAATSQVVDAVKKSSK
jgi:phasin family protein